MTQHCNCICMMHLYVLSCCMVLRHGDRGRCAGAVWNHVSWSSGSFFGLSLVCVQALPTRRCWASLGGSLWRTPQHWPSVGSGTGWSRCRTPASPSRLSWRTVPWPPDQRAPHAAQHAGLPRCVRSCTSCHPSLTASRSALTHLLSVHTCNAACTMTFDIDYILVVGQFGLATGSGGITQSNVHNELCPK